MTRATQERVNGVAEALRTAVRTGRVELGGDYEGWYATMRTNPTVSVWEDFASGDNERFDEALKILVLDWNFVDDQGQPLPLPNEGLDWRAAPFDLKLALTNAYSAIIQERMSVGKSRPTPSEPTSQNAT